MKRSQIVHGEIGEFYWNYINLISEEAELVETLKKNTQEFCDFLKTVPQDKWQYVYASDKWSIAQMVQHILDTERIFQYRALCFARGETKALPGFDHDFYAMNCPAKNREAEDLIQEFRANRESCIFLFKSFSDEMLMKPGNMNEMNATPRAIGFIMAGHVLHHMNILKNRYL